MVVKSEALDWALRNIPGVAQSNPAEDSNFVRFTVQLDIDPFEHHQLPEAFLLLTQNEFRQACGAPALLEQIFKRKIERDSFKDAVSGETIHTGIQKDAAGIWRARTVDGLMWVFDTDRKRWIRENSLAA